ncbi:MAG: UDP-N-acetylmuramate--L-alanine ligase [Deltaproteobacteria bacterium]|nr:UDP-N-acetylmuramate--L-alanine ligase [Deltaproteobacteria bacterium]
MYNFGQHLHFIGIGGVGMAGIAEVLLTLGYSISGSDVRSSSLIERLIELGAQVAIGHDAKNIPAHTSIVVISSAIEESNVELRSVRERELPVIPRAEMLAELMRMKYGIAIAGSHGKTTTTSMIAKILTDIGLDPTVIIGGRLLNQVSGARVGQGQYLVAESDESDGSFNMLRPAIAVVTNIDAEHLNYYGSFGALEQAFEQFMGSVPFYGVVVACFDDPVVAKLAKNIKRRVISYGLAAHANYSAKDIVFNGNESSYMLVLDDREVGYVPLPLPGLHMVANSLAAIAVGVELGAYANEVISCLASFPGVGRRSELVGEVCGIRIIDDYGHHPTEIRNTLSSLHQGWIKPAEADKKGRLIVLFQPHRYSRTKDLFSEFLTCFNDADYLYVGDIYSAGEANIEGISGKALAQAMNRGQVSYCNNFSALIPTLVRELKEGDIVVTLGAGSITNISRELLYALKTRFEG